VKFSTSEVFDLRYFLDWIRRQAGLCRATELGSSEQQKEYIYLNTYLTSPSFDDTFHRDLALMKY